MNGPLEPTEEEKALLKLIDSSSAGERLTRLHLAFNHVIEARNACREFRHSLPPDQREAYSIRLVTVETLCNIALVDARKAGVRGLKEESSDE